jgi:hypothetical protein
MHFYYDSTNSQWVELRNYALNKLFTSYDDFLGLPTATSSISSGRTGMFNVVGSGTGAGLAAAGVTNVNALNAGIIQTGTTTTGYTYLSMGNTSLGTNQVWTYEGGVLMGTRCAISSAADATNDYTATIGFTKNTGISTPATSVLAGFTYQRSLSATNWYVSCGTNTQVSAGIAALDNNHMYVYIGAAKSKAQFIMWAPTTAGGSVYQWTIIEFTTNLGTDVCAPYISIGKSAGTTNRYMGIDWVGIIRNTRL